MLSWLWLSHLASWVNYKQFLQQAFMLEKKKLKYLMCLEWLSTLGVKGKVFQKSAFQQLEKQLHIKLTSQFKPQKWRCWITQTLLIYPFSLWDYFLCKMDQDFFQLFFEVLYCCVENTPWYYLWHEMHSAHLGFL